MKRFPFAHASATRSGPGRWVVGSLGRRLRRRTHDARVRDGHRARVSPHVVRHTTAMHLLQAGVDMATIALWLGHERLETTHQYVEADLQLKEDALRKLEPLGQRTPRFKADSSLLAFLASL